MADLGSSRSKETIKKMKDEFGSFEIEPQELEYFEKIGTGSFGDVFRGKCRGKEVAIKKLKGQEMTAEQLEELRREIQIMSGVFHTNIVLFMGACLKKNSMAIVSELMPEGSVSALIRNEKAHVTLLNKLMIAKDCCLGMNWLHSRSPTILHRDLKPANLLIDKEWNVKICDFGLSTMVEKGKMWEDEDDIPGTPLWMAPEVMLGKQIDGKADVYSFGLVLWELFSIEEPFSEFTNFNDFRKAICSKGVRPPIPKSMPRAVEVVVKMCWDADPKRRPTFAELLPMLEKVTLQCMVTDKVGQQFWSESLKKEGEIPTEVGWNRFMSALLAYLKLPAQTYSVDPGVLSIKALIGKASSHPGGDATVVSVEDFGHFLNWFGPMPPAGDGGALIEKVTAVASYRPKKKTTAHVFHGKISSQDAEKLLTGMEKGTWLIRVSDKEARQPFVISKVSRNGPINHQRIHYDPETRRYRVDIRIAADKVKQAESVDDNLIEFIKTLKEDLYLRSAASGSVFVSVFQQAQSDGYLA